MNQPNPKVSRGFLIFGIVVWIVLIAMYFYGVKEPLKYFLQFVVLPSIILASICAYVFRDKLRVPVRSELVKGLLKEREEHEKLLALAEKDPELKKRLERRKRLLSSFVDGDRKRLPEG